MNAPKVYNVLFLCTGNSARSIMAEAILNAQSAGRFRGFSAGSHAAGTVNPRTIELLQRNHFKTEGLHSKSWDAFSGADAVPLDIVITVCDSAAAETCPVFHGPAGRGAPVKVHWGYPDPSNAEGGDEGKRRAFELTRQAIGYRMLQLLALPLATLDRAALQAALADIGRR